MEYINGIYMCIEICTMLNVKCNRHRYRDDMYIDCTLHCGMYIAQNLLHKNEVL